MIDDVYIGDYRGPLSRTPIISLRLMIVDDRLSYSEALTINHNFLHLVKSPLSITTLADDS